VEKRTAATRAAKITVQSKPGSWHPKIKKNGKSRKSDAKRTPTPWFKRRKGGNLHSEKGNEAVRLKGSNAPRKGTKCLENEKGKLRRAASLHGWYQTHRFGQEEGSQLSSNRKEESSKKTSTREGEK